MRMSLVCLLALPSWALAADYVGSDLNGANLVLADGDTVRGIFTNVGEMVIPANAVVEVDGNEPLEVHAQRINIQGVLDGTGAGGIGGAGAPSNCGFPYVNGDDGGGEGGGGGGTSQSRGGGGGGGGNGGKGGDGGWYTSPTNGEGGEVVGGPGDFTVRPVGGGGGGAGCDTWSRNTPTPDGGNGGASIYLNAPLSLVVDGEIIANGERGGDGIPNPSSYGEDGGGGGGAGGTIVLQSYALRGTGTLTANGGGGGDKPFPNRWTTDLGGAGGGGGAGGRIKIYHGLGYTDELITSVEGAPEGLTVRTYSNSDLSGPGEEGTVFFFEQDPDPDDDNISSIFDNCPEVFNPVQFDDDGDGLGDACDICPNRGNGTDSDGDTVCDADDVCAFGDDFDDFDLDGVPAACDNCPLRANPDQADADDDTTYVNLGDGERGAVIVGLGDACDPCPTPENGVDSDGDDVCDKDDLCAFYDDRTDTDFDGIPNDCDLCPTAYDPEQRDADGDSLIGDREDLRVRLDELDEDFEIGKGGIRVVLGLGDACDRCPNPEDPVDSDSDGVCDFFDKCPGFFDGFDDDGDGIPNACDRCPQDPFDDSDRDGLCGNIDVCPWGGDGGPDEDKDSIPDFCDNCPLVPNPTQGDTDFDSFGDACDCAPGIGTAYDGAPEICNNFDDDCDGVADNDVIDAKVWFADVDRDGYGDPDATSLRCFREEGYVGNADDCDDSSPTAFPGNLEVCDGLDNNCDGVVDPVELECGLAPVDNPGQGGQVASDSDGSLTACGCSSNSGVAPVAGLVFLMPWLLRRRRTV